MKKLISYIKNPEYILLGLDRKKIITLNDKTYLKILYKDIMGKSLNLDNPKTFNEKLQWLKLYDRKDIYTTMVDKEKVKKYVADIIGEEYIIPTLGVYDNFDDINFETLPNQFVIKCTHDSGGIVIVKNKNKLNINKARKKINNSLKTNYYRIWREWPYKNVKPRIIIEEYMEDNKYKELRDYKFFAFFGNVKLMFVATNRQGIEDTYFDFFDKKYNHLDIIQGHPNAPYIPDKPKNYNTMIALAEKLGRDIPQVRIDFYEVDGKVYFGEMTFSHYAGIVPFVPEDWDYKLGDLLDLSKIDRSK